METKNFPTEKIKNFVEKFFDTNVLPNLMDFVRIPNLSRDFDPEILTNGLQEKAAQHIFNWVKAQNLKNLTTAEIIHEKGKNTPTLLFIIEGSVKNSGTALFYGHFDKQPPMFDGWKEGTGPFTPTIIDNKLYGRGGVDDGYSSFAVVSIIKACQDNQLDHPRVVMLIEGDEESQGEDIPVVLAQKKELIGNVDLVFVLDSGAWNYETLWVTSTLKGVVEVKLTVQVLDEGVHSGSASGVVPSSFRIIRQLLDRIDNVENGQVNEIFQTDIPPYIYEQYKNCIDVVGKEKVIDCFPWFENTQPTLSNPFQAYLNRAWRPQLSITGIDGIPPPQIAGNVLRPLTTVKLSMRLPPNLDSKVAVKNLIEILTKDPPYNAKVTAEVGYAGNGFYVRETADYLKKSLKSSSMNFFGQQEQYIGEGGSIPIVDLFYEYYPKAQFIITGACGPGSNAHGPNETLDLPFIKKLICCMTQLCYEMGQHYSNN